jgi:hypothetical protein
MLGWNRPAQEEKAVARSDMFRALYHKAESDQEREVWQKTLIYAIALEKVSCKSPQELYQDHFAPDSPDEILKGALTLEEVEKLCFRFRPIVVGAEVEKTKKKKNHPENLEAMITRLANKKRVSLRGIHVYYHRVVEPSYEISEGEFWGMVIEFHRARESKLQTTVRI